jgi:chromosome segregation protein
MYLKSLEIFGFKSFAPKTVLNFDPGVTCVVGPNGCGKSNVLDSIRWVLGEQSAKALRGGEMTDVIFSGTDSRPALGMAEVSMTFSECEEQLGLDWHEVKITRRVFREGGSEYLLNGTPCRLKDIHTLFMDTGIGRSAYSIMEQGKIDLILSSRPEDRRAIFEEAAGITKYKSQRKEALRKLEATEANLVRLADIIKEVKRQIGSVQRQAAKARRYQGMLEDLRTLETHQAKRQFDELDGSRAANMVELEALSVRHYESEIAVSSKEEEANAQRAAVEEMEGRLNSARQTVQDLRQRIANHESRLSFNSERAAEFASLMERYRADIAGAEEKFRTAETQLRDMDGEMEQITELLASELRRMEEVQAQASGMSAQRQQADSQISAMNNEAARAESKLGSLRAQTGTVLQQREAAEARLAALAGEIGQLEFAFARANEELTSTQAELGRMLHELEERTAALSGAEVHHRDAQAKVGELDIEMRETLRVLADRESRLQVLKQLNNGGEGLSEGTQAVLRGLDNAEFFKPAIHGALAQCMEVAPEFIPAVEAVLGSQIQTIVMKDTMIAESVIKTLTAQKLGKASLALRDLDSVFEHVRSETMHLPEGSIDWLINKIKPQPEVARLLERLVNHTVLVPDLATALRIFPQIRGSAVVTLAGEVITGHGILQGGATAGENNSILARRNQITALETEIAAVREQLVAQQARHEAATLAVENSRHAIDEARLEKENATVQVSTLRNQVQLLERERGEGEKKVMTLDIEKQNADARLAEANQRTAELEAEIKAAMDQFESCIARRAEAQQAIETLRAQENEIVADLNDLKVKVATERQRHSLLHHQRQPMEARIEELEQLMQERRNDIRNYEERATALLAENAEIEANMERLRGSIGEAEAAVAALQEERHVITASAQEIAEALRELRREQSHCVEQRGALEVRVTQLEMRANAIHDHISKRYQVDLREFTPDSYALNACIREIGKRVRKFDVQAEAASEGANDTGAGNEATEAADISAEASEAAEDAGAQEAGEMPPVQIDWARIETVVRELDTRLAGMGPVNLDAIAEFEELEQRHTFLEQQITDTTNAKNELIDVINKINTTTKTLFADTFEKIRVNFQEMFKELFGGGQANLVLSMEEDPLESGIEIIAKPPGKQLQSITLLSGGEKTMTAVALLFSIYMVKPSPFCVLDEMDAPLDESNINRFIKILDRFVQQSQFVVISHNKRTIARADALYGVTMEEHGVSKLVGVKFRARSDAHESRDILGSENATPVPSVAESFGKSGDLHSEGIEAVRESGGAM